MSREEEKVFQKRVDELKKQTVEFAVALANHQPLLCQDKDVAQSKFLSTNIDVSIGVISLLDFPLPTVDFQIN
jgi:hypothetical protein